MKWKNITWKHFLLITGIKFPAPVRCHILFPDALLVLSKILNCSKFFRFLQIIEPPPIVSVNLCGGWSQADNTRGALKELNQSFTSVYNHDFTSSLIKTCGATEKIQKKCPQRKSKKGEELNNVTWNGKWKHTASKATMSFLSENEFFKDTAGNIYSNYSLETTKSWKRSHIRKVEKTLQYKSLVIDQLSEIPPDSLINWSEIDRKCNIPGKNKGQIAKQIALMSGFDIDDKGKPWKKSTRQSKAKFAGNEVSSNCANI